MGEPTIEITKKTLEDALNDALKNYFPRIEPTSNARVEFYNRFQHKADEYDRDFLNKYNTDLDTTMIFAGLFSAVTSAFVIAIQTRLQPDYTQLSYEVLVAIANSNGLKVSTKPDSHWAGQDPTLIYIESALFSSLAASLLAAFVAMLGKQWLNRYSKVGTRGSLIDRSRDRQRKMDGILTRGFDIVMESLPLILQSALFLIGCALSTYFFIIDKVAAAVIIAVALLFYGGIIFATLLSHNFPFRTPITLIIRSIVLLVKKRRKYLKRFREWLRRMSYRIKRPRVVDRHDHAEQATTGPPDRPPVLFDKDTNWEGHILDSKCIAWMFEKSTDADVVLNIMRLIPEVVWHDGIRTSPMERLYDTVVECLDPSDRSAVIPKFRDKAYLSAKALLHVAVQRKCVGNGFDEEAFESISRQHMTIGYEGDPDLESTLGMIDRIFDPGSLEPICWQKYSFTDSHRDWMGRILLYHAWDSFRKGGALPVDTREFILRSLQVNRPPPASIVTSCLDTIGLVLGIQSPHDDQKVTDQSLKFRSQIGSIYKKLVEIFKNLDLTIDESPDLKIYEVNCAIEAMELLAPLSEEIAAKSYGLFHVIMQAQVHPTYAERKWEASRLAMDGAYKWDEVLPPVGDPQDVLTFLNYHFSSTAQYQDEPIQNALRALGSIPSHAMNEAFRGFNDQTRSSFVRGIRHAFRNDRPLKLRKAAFFFLPVIADSWFNVSPPVMEDEEMGGFSMDWASAVDGVGATNDVRKATLTVLFDMINSAHWRPHIVAGKWSLLKDFISDPDGSEPLRRCLGNPELIDAIPNVGSPGARALWLAILWLKHDELTPSVREKLETATGEVSRTDFYVCLSGVDSELRKAEGVLGKEKSSLERAKGTLMALEQVIIDPGLL